MLLGPLTQSFLSHCSSSVARWLRVCRTWLVSPLSTETLLQGTSCWMRSTTARWGGDRCIWWHTTLVIYFHLALNQVVWLWNDSRPQWGGLLHNKSGQKTPYQVDGSWGGVLQEVQHQQWCVELWDADVWDMVTGTHTIWRFTTSSGHSNMSNEVTDSLCWNLCHMYAHAMRCLLANIYFFWCRLLMHHLLAHISLLMMQVAKLLEERYCQPPPPGCPRAVYAIMVDCWWGEGEGWDGRGGVKGCYCSHFMTFLHPPPRHPDPHYRPPASSLCSSLKQPEPLLLFWDQSTPAPSPSSHVLGAPLEEGHKMYGELQSIYQDYI